MSCRPHQNAVDYWDPGCSDLPDATALHLDHCPACLERFETRFVPVEQHPVSTQRPLRVPALAAAAIALFLALPSALPTSEQIVVVDLSECFEEVILPPVCEV